MKKSSLLMAAFAVLLLFSATPVYADTFTVDSESSLLSAISVAQSEDLIFVMQDITLHERIYIIDKNLTIQGADPSVTIRRGSGFKTASDRRGNFNPGMLEVAVSDVGNDALASSIVLKNITFDDTPAGVLTNNNSNEMTIAVPGGSDEYTADWEQRIPDSIVSAYDSKTAVTLSEGAAIKNPSSFSVIMLTNGATGMMENGASIECQFDRDVFHLANSAALTIKGNITGGIKANNLVYAKNHVDVNHPGYQDNFYKIHLNGNISNIDVKNMTYAVSGGNVFLNGTVQNSVADGSIIYATGGSHVDLYGNISNNTLTHAIHAASDSNAFLHQNRTNIILHQNSKISNNTGISAGTVYIQYSSNLDIYGEISGNICKDNNGGAVYMVHNSTGTMYDSANISNNTVKSSGGGSSGGGIYINHNTTFTMNGGIISGNKAEGGYSALKENGDYGGGGVSVIRKSVFVMNGGTISDNEVAVGGGVWVSGKEVSGGGSSFIFNGGTVQNNYAADTGSQNVTYGNDIALMPCNASSSSEGTGHYIFIGKNAVVGDGLIGVAQSALQTAVSGYHQAVYLTDKSDAAYFGTLKTDLETSVITEAGITGYDNTKSSLWIKTEKTSGSFNLVSTLSDVSELNENEYQIIVASLDDSFNILSVQAVRPPRTADGLSIDIPINPAASSYGIIILKEVKTSPFNLTISHEGTGEFYFEDYPTDTEITLNSGDTVQIAVQTTGRWYVRSVKLTAGDGSVFEKYVVNGFVEVDYYDLAAGDNNIHAVFAIPTGGSGSGTGSAATDNSTEQGNSGFEEPVSPGEEETPGKAALAVPTLIILFFVLAVAVFVFIYKRNEEKEE